MANAVCIPCGEKDVQTGYTFLANAGVRLNNNFVFDIAAHTWRSLSQYNNKKHRSGILVRAHYFPFKAHKLHFSGGFGIRNYTFTPDTAITIGTNEKTLGTLVGLGPDFMLGIGYEIKLNPKLSLRPAVNAYLSFPGNLKVNNLNGTIVSNKRPSMLGELLFTLNYYIL